MSDYIEQIEQPVFTCFLQHRVPVHTEGECKEIYGIPFNGDIPSDAEKILLDGGKKIQENFPQITIVADGYYRARYGFGPRSNVTLPVKLVIREGFPERWEPALLVDGELFTMRGWDELEDITGKIVQEYTFYCEI